MREMLATLSAVMFGASLGVTAAAILPDLDLHASTSLLAFLGMVALGLACCSKP